MKTPDLYTPTGQCCELDEPYQAPVGFYDQPFWYVFNADSLTDGQDYRLLNLKTFTGADFILRRIAGIDRCSVQAQFRDVLARVLFNTNFNTAGFGDFPLVPEMIWPSGTNIQFDLLNLLRSTNSSGAFLSQVVFQGARRFKGYRRPPSYPYWEDEFNYVIDPAITWPIGQTVTFTKQVYDFDFELLRIEATVLNPIGGGASIPSSGVFKLQLYDQVYEKVFQEPVIDDLLIDNATNYQGVTPVPGIVYRIGQQIRVDVTSLVTAGVCPVQIQIRFHGVRRRPC